MTEGDNASQLYRVKIDFSETEKLYTFDDSFGLMNVGIEGMVYAKNCLFMASEDSLYAMRLDRIEDPTRLSIEPEIIAKFDYFLGDLNGYIYFSCEEYLVKINIETYDVSVVLEEKPYDFDAQPESGPIDTAGATALAPAQAEGSQPPIESLP